MQDSNVAYGRTLKVATSDIPGLIDICLSSKNNLLIVGDPGTGKSTVIKEMANQGYKVTMLTGSSTYEESVNGIPYRDQTKKSVCGNDISVYNVPSWLENVANTQDKQILFIDEFNTADPQVLKTFLSILTERKVPTQDDALAIPDNCVIVAAMNPANQNDGEQLIRPLKSRFMTVQIMSTLNNFKSYILGNNPCANIDKDQLALLVDQLDKDRWGQEGAYFELNPRSFTNFLRAIDSIVPSGNAPTACPDLSLAFFGQSINFPTDGNIVEMKEEQKKAKNPYPTFDELKQMETEELKILYKLMSVKFTYRGDKVCMDISTILTTRGETI